MLIRNRSGYAVEHQFSKSHNAVQGSSQLMGHGRQKTSLGGARLAAREASAAKGRFLGAMSHELRTPLNGIMGLAELMFDGITGPVTDEHKEYLGDILASSRHLLQLVNDVLDIAKVESGKMDFRKESVELAPLLREVRDVL